MKTAYELECKLQGLKGRLNHGDIATEHILFHMCLPYFYLLILTGEVERTRF